MPCERMQDEYATAEPELVGPAELSELGDGPLPLQAAKNATPRTATPQSAAETIERIIGCSVRRWSAALGLSGLARRR
jgi:hypothetical protein